LSAVLAIAAGIVLLGWPVRGAVSLTLLLIVFFIIEGVLSIMYAFEHKKELSGQWGWMLVSGIIDLILAAIILAGLPGTAEWGRWLGWARQPPFPASPQVARGACRAVGLRRPGRAGRGA